MTTLDADIAALLAALDEGDDSVLAILADALEEAGDPRSSGVRLVPESGRTPASVAPPQAWKWTRYHAECVVWRDTLAPEVFDRLTPGSGAGRSCARARAAGHGLLVVDSREYVTRSAAILALAAALAVG